MGVSHNDRVIWEVIGVDLCNICVIFHGSHVVFVAPNFAVATNPSVKIKYFHW